MKAWLCRPFLGALASAALLSGCTMRPVILSAHAFNANGSEVLQVQISAKDAKKIKHREMYFSMAVVECDRPIDGYRATPYIGERRASKFDFPVAGADITMIGNVPDRIFSTYQKPCVFLQGGSYLLRHLKSEPVVISVSGGR